MNILYLSHRLPFPQYDRLSLTGYSTLYELSMQGIHCTLLTSETKHSAHRITETDSLPFHIYYSAKNTHTLIDTARCVFSGYPLSWSSQYSATTYTALKNVLTHTPIDLLHTDDIRMLMYIESLHREGIACPPIVLRECITPSSILTHQAQHESQIWRTMWLRRQADIMKHVEKHLRSYCTGIVRMTHHDDTESLTSAPHQQTINTGISIPPGSLTVSTFPNSLCSLLDLRNPVNCTGIEWFLGNVLPLLEQYFPPHDDGTEYHIGGAYPPPHILQYDNPPEHIHLHPTPHDGAEFLKMYDIVIAPQRPTHGMSSSVLYAMAQSKAIIATPEAVRGMTCISGKEVLIANTPIEFVQAIGILINDSALKQSLQSSAYRYAQSHHAIEQTTAELINVYHACLARA